MSEVIDLKQVLSTYRVKIVLIDRVKGIIRLSGPEGNHEYLTSHLTLDPRFQTGDYVDAVIIAGRIQTIAYPPGGEPIEPTKIQPTPQPKSEPAKVQAPTVQKPKVCRLLKRDGDAKALVLTLLGAEKWFPLDENAQKNLKRLKDGQNVILGFMGETLTKLLPATPGGGYDKEGWVKSFGGPGRQFNPEADAKRQKMIVRQSSLERSVAIWINGNPGKVCVESDEDTILKRADYFAGWVMSE